VVGQVEDIHQIVQAVTDGGQCAADSPGHFAQICRRSDGATTRIAGIPFQSRMSVAPPRCRSGGLPRRRLSA
jgi:hypothetical protein